MELTKYTEKLRELAEYYFREEQSLSTTQRCCISLKKNEAFMICIDHRADIDNVILLKSFKYEDIDSIPLVLKGVIEQNHLSQTPVHWLLEPDDYQLNLIESMPVPENEFLTALNWRIRSLINYPIDEAVLEYFELPAKRNSPNSPLIATVTAQKTNLFKTLNMFKDCGLSMTNINIPEIALLRLAALNEIDEKSTAFLYFFDKYIMFNISNRKTLYFTRRIKKPLTDTGEIDFEELSLEILRYFDFFRSQWRLASPARILIAADNGQIGDTAKILTERLMSPVENYTLQASMIDGKNKTELYSRFLLSYGCLI